MERASAVCSCGKDRLITKMVSVGILSSNFAKELGIATGAVSLYGVHMMRKAGAANIIELSRLIDELHSEGQDRIILPLNIIAKVVHADYFKK